MKTIYFLRHSKTEEKLPGQSDFERTLKDRGKSDARLMSKKLAHTIKNPIEKVITSPSKRTLETLDYFAQQLDIGNDVIIQEPKLYNAAKEHLLEAIWGMDNDFNTIMLIGHNPGISDIVDYLSKHAVDPMPTTGLACMEFNVELWNAIVGNSGRMLYQDHPKLH